MSFYSKFFFKPSGSEQIETAVHIESDLRCAFLGRVVDSREQPVSDAVILLFKTGASPGEYSLLARSVSDEDGHFIFGPLDKDLLYLVKVFKNDLKLRELEIRT